MKPLLFNPKILFGTFIFFLASCTSNDVGEDKDGPTKKGYPEVTTRTVIVSSLGISAESGGNVSASGDSEVTSRGVCWSKKEKPTIADFFTQDGKGIGEFSSAISGLEVNTKYYLRSYATNKFGTKYGGEVDFFTAKIYRGDVFLTSQEEVDVFGAENYLTIIGDFFIGKTDGSDITSLKPLSSINQIRGNLSIGSWKQGNPLLLNLEGLEYLALIDTYYLNDFIPKNLEIAYNDNLENIDALKGLGYFNGDLKIFGNDKLKNLEGLNNIRKAEDVQIYSNLSLTDLDVLSSIENIHGKIYINNNPLITNLNGLKNITESVEEIRIYRNENLSDISILSKVTYVKYNLWLIECPKINSIEDLKNITEIGGDLGIVGLGITNLNGLNALSSLGKVSVGPGGSFNLSPLTITENKNLTNFCDIKPLLETPFSSQIKIQGNSFNPSKEDILAGNCKN